MFLLRGLIALLIGLGISLALGIQYFDFHHKALLDQVFMVGAPTLSFVFLLWISFPAIRAHVSKPILISGVIAAVPGLIHLALIQRAFPAGWQQMFLAAGLVLFYGSGIFLARHRLLKALREFLQWRMALTALIFLLFDAGVIAMALQFPILFHPEQFLPPTGNLAWIGFGLLAGLSALGICISRAQGLPLLNAARRRVLGGWLEENLPGLFAAAAVFPGYFILAHGYNPPVDGLNLNNTFFASDTYSWQVCFGTEQGCPIGRAVHPLALPVLRGASSTLAFLHGGDWRLASLLLISLAASACVFLAWYFVYQASRTPSYALAFSGLLALSASHLVFGSVTETYIFSAFSLLWFFVFLLARTRPLKDFLAPGLLTLGITISNVAQSLLAFLLIRRDGREWARFASALLTIGIALTILTVLVYPGNIKLFFVPSDLLMSETQHASYLQAWTQLPNRFALVAKNMLLYDVVAVPPVVSRVDKAGRDPFPKFNFFHPPLGLKEYRSFRLGLPTLALWALVITHKSPFARSATAGERRQCNCHLNLWVITDWVALLVGAGSRFIWRGKKSPFFPFQLAFLSVLLLNLILHLFYGREPFLYTPNWTYALLLFIALSFADLPKREWLEWTLLLFLFLLLVNNGSFLLLMTSHLSPYFPATGG